jgi:hypothetical protein
MNFKIIDIIVFCACLLLLAGACSFTYRLGGNSARAELATFKEQVAKNTLAAQEAQQIIEQQRAQDAQRIEDETTTEITAARADADAARAAAYSMRKRLNALISAGKERSNPAVGQGSESIGDSANLDMLANVLWRMENAGRSASEYADRLRIAGAACERQYESLGQ